MEDNHMDELIRQESLLRLGAALDEIEENRRNGVPDIPAEEVIARMRKTVDDNRRRTKVG